MTAPMVSSTRANTAVSPKGATTRGGPTTARISSKLMVQLARSTVTGSTESLVTRLHALAIGLAGMERQLSSFASEGYSITKTPTRVTGPKM